MDNRKIRRLTKAQIDEYYAEYRKQSHTYKEGAMDKITWTAVMEENLNRHAVDQSEHFSKTAIKNANRKIILADQFSYKQKEALRESFKRGLVAPITEGMSDIDEAKMWKEFKKTHPEITPYNISQYANVFYQWLTSYSGEWNQYFNS